MSEEAIGLPRDQRELDLFNMFVDDMGLLELPLGGAAFTWTNSRLNPSLSRLDRAFVTEDWDNLFADVSLVARTRVCSDHCPIEIRCGQREIIKRPWRLELMWFTHEDFDQVVTQNWQQSAGRCQGFFAVARKLKRLKEFLIVWNRDVFKRVEGQIELVLRKVAELDSQEERGVLSEDAGLERCNLKCSLLQLWKQEYLMWKQKSREKCQVEGDQNTSYFHKIASQNRRSNSTAIWDPVIASVRKRLEGWKARLLSFGGRVVLLKSVLSHLPTYFLSILRIPATVLAKLESIQKRFLWGGLEEKRRIHLISWDWVKTAKCIGGLGVVSRDVLTEGPPSVVWSLAASGLFSVKSLKAHLSRQRFPGVDEFPKDTVWSRVVPTKIQGFGWLAFHGRISTTDVLQARGF
ncbi:Putative ribonuclease H protein At1g65750 [Linum perenne]